MSRGGSLLRMKRRRDIEEKLTGPGTLGSVEFGLAFALSSRAYA